MRAGPIRADTRVEVRDAAGRCLYVAYPRTEANMAQLRRLARERGGKIVVKRGKSSRGGMPTAAGRRMMAAAIPPKKRG